MKIKSLVITISAFVGVIVGTEVIYNGLNAYINYKAEKQKELNSELQQLTPKENEIGQLKSQLMFLDADKDKLTAANQEVMVQCQRLINGKTSGVIKINIQLAKEVEEQINNYWKNNNTFSTVQGQEGAKNYDIYLNKVNAYLNEGIKTGEINIASMPSFTSADISALSNQINNVKVQLLALGASLNMNGATPYTLQNSQGYVNNTGY